MSAEPFLASPDSVRPWIREPILRPVENFVPTQSRGVPTEVGVRVLGGDALSREGVIRFLQESPGVRIRTEPVGDDGAGADAADIAVVVIDRVSDATVRLLRSMRYDGGPRVLLVVGDLETSRTAEVMQAGAVGIVRRSEVTRDGLRRAIRTVVAGEAVVPPDVLTALLGRPHPHGPRPNGAALDDREEKVVRLLADGSDTREIAHLLCYSERTVKAVIQDITHRFGLRNRSHAVAYALRQGLI